MRNQIVEQLRKARDEQAATLNFDLKAILADAHKRLKSSGHRLESFVSKPKNAK